MKFKKPAEKGQTKNQEYIDTYQQLFNYMSHEHGLILTHHELDEIIRLSKKIK